jgi:hypothetical protein
MLVNSSGISGIISVRGVEFINATPILAIFMGKCG